MNQHSSLEKVVLLVDVCSARNSWVMKIPKLVHGVKVPLEDTQFSTEKLVCAPTEPGMLSVA